MQSLKMEIWPLGDHMRILTEQVCAMVEVEARLLWGGEPSFLYQKVSTSLTRDNEGDTDGSFFASNQGSP